jgi:hypothetical protein
LCTLSIKAGDGYFEKLDSISIELVDSELPILEISEPSKDGEFDCGEIIEISGFVSDNTEVSILRISLDSGDSWMDLTPVIIEDNWVYTWDTSGFGPGVYTISVEASDGINPPVLKELDINLVDVRIPILEILSPLDIGEYQLGDMVLIEGKVSDDIGISSLSISIDNGITWTDLTSDLDNKGKWSYIWDTSDLKPGSYYVRIKASDGTNEAEESITIELGEKENEDTILTFPMLVLLIMAFLIIVLTIVGTIAVKKLNKKN